MGRGPARSRGCEETTVPDEGVRKPRAAKKKSYKAKHKIRFVTATSLFDGHDASINIFRRILQASGAEVIHLGHNRSVEEIVTAATSRASPSAPTRAATSSSSGT
jgi:methanogenic corrinoid protein MtbC1